MKKNVTNQGTAVVSNVNGDWLVMFPNGKIEAYESMEKANKRATKWFQKDARKRGLQVGVGIIDTDPNED